MDQLALFETEDEDVAEETRPNLEEYDFYIVAWSGGKDSLACILHLLEAGVPREKLELWHHEIDGRDENGNAPARGLMDWPSTPGYCKTVAEALGIDLYFSWKVGGFEAEMLRENELTNPICFETPSGEIRMKGGENGSPNTRRKFPQQSANLSTRWCSGYLKVDVARTALRNQERFRNAKTLFVTGERAEESSARKEYAKFEKHDCDLRDGVRFQRLIDHWRPVHSWSEQRVWDIIECWSIRPHPAYQLGWGRVSCMTCIFGSANQWASVKEIAPEKFERIAKLEEEFGYTIDREMSVREQARIGEAYEGMDQETVRDALDPDYDRPAKVEEWTEPSGAFGESCGPI